MSSLINGILDRNHIIAHLVPACVALLAAEFIFLLNMNLDALLSRYAILDGYPVRIGLAASLSLFLALANRPLIVILEGYGRFNPLYLGKYFHRWNYDRMKNRRKQAIDADKKDEATALRRRIALSYPHEKKWVLGTEFGNVLRAFEVYPKVVYGLEGTTGWYRLIFLIPPDRLAVLDRAKSLMDTFVNFTYLGISFLVAITMLLYRDTGSERQPLAISLGVIVALTWIAYRQAIVHAIVWGEFMKAACDVYVHELYRALKLGSGDEADLVRQDRMDRMSASFVFREPLRTWAERHSVEPNTDSLFLRLWDFLQSLIYRRP